MDDIRSTLTSEREELVHQLEEFGATDRGNLRSDAQFSGSFADAGAATAERSEVIGIIQSLARRVRMVDRALAKIDEGTYGICDRCGERIPEARLEARPESVFCVDCKSRS
ncbi:MAG: TraR/DksA family transcriptional regulator [Gammaproteobacteria bacterium]|nr:TraR/DksA family transcriptional regulator [Gammaproteobacteria bacterium]